MKEFDMKIVGQLKEDILNGNAILFLGAGASQAADLLGTKDLANYLFKMAGNPHNYIDFKDDFPRLVAKIDKDPYFTRKWVNNQMIQYFINIKNYNDLETHKCIFQFDWKAIFTTNYDLCMEYAENKLESQNYRLFPIINPKELESIYRSQEGKLKYFKIHGCCNELEKSPSSSPPLVITQSDFRQSIARNKPFFDKLKEYAYDCSIIFVGFQAHRSENNLILANIIETYNTLASSFHQPFKAFTVLKDVTSSDRSDIEESGLTLLEGTFQELMESINTLQIEQKTTSKLGDINRKIWIKLVEKEVGLTLGEHKQFSSQFNFYHEQYLEDESNKIEHISNNKLADMWKANPTDLILSKGYYIKRTIFEESTEKLEKIINDVKSSKNSELLIVTGKRASGKSALSRQLLNYAYSELHQPALSLTPQASYLEKSAEFDIPTNISGWDAKQIDKFLSLFSDSDEEKYTKTIPVILADHLFNRTNALDHLISYLENHGKPCVLILTLNQDEFEKLQNSDSVDRLLQLYNYQYISVPHKLDDQEIDDLFDIVSKLEPRVNDARDMLLDRAKWLTYCNRDILLILYTWFDKKYRRFEEIISDEIEKLNDSDLMKKIYLAVAVFHQYDFTPRLSICAEALDINIETFSDLRSLPNFRALLNVENIMYSEKQFASTRHSEFSRRILQKLMPNTDEQVILINKVLSHCGQAELLFVRDFFISICRYEASFTIEQVESIKDATEINLDDDYVLNHQFGAYLIREGTKLEDARYYLDLASEENPENSSIIHSLGNLCYKIYKDEADRNPVKAFEYYDFAKKYFSKTRTISKFRDEHAYYTEISMINHRLNNVFDDDGTKVLLTAEKNALLFEGLEVIPSSRHNYLTKMIDQEISFHQLPQEDQQIIISMIMEKNAHPWMLEYYSKSLLAKPNKENYNKLSELVSLYWEIGENNPSIAIIIASIAKYAFIKNAKTRFEYLRGFFDKLIRYKEIKINFPLLARYARLVLIDALVLEKYDFLRETSGDIINTFRDSKPRFLKDEFVLEKDYYYFDENDFQSLIDYFENKIDYYSSKNARRYHSIVNLDHYEGLRSFRLELDPISRYYIKGIRKEVAISGKAELNFSIKHSYDGFMASDFRT